MSAFSSSVRTNENQRVAADRESVGRPVEKEEGRETGGVKALEIGGVVHEKEKELERDGADESDEEEEEGECGFCLFMKGGGCRDAFIAWENCVEEAEKNKKDIVETCFEVTGMLKKCMDAHADYYAPVLQAEKVMEEEAARGLEQGAAVQEAEDSAGKGAVKDLEGDRAVQDPEKTAEEAAVETLERDRAVHKAAEKGAVEAMERGQDVREQNASAKS